MENLKNVFKSNFLKDLDKEKNMDLSFESTEHNIYFPNFSSGNVTPRVVDHEPEDYNFNDYLGGLPEIKKKKFGGRIPKFRFFTKLSRL